MLHEILPFLLLEFCSQQPPVDTVCMQHVEQCVIASVETVTFDAVDVDELVEECTQDYLQFMRGAK